MNEEITNLKDEAVENVAGGWAGEYANYTYEQFSDAGVVWTRNSIHGDTYTYNGKQISRSIAERYVEEYIRELYNENS